MSAIQLLEKIGSTPGSKNLSLEMRNTILKNLQSAKSDRDKESKIWCLMVPAEDDKEEENEGESENEEKKQKPPHVKH